MTEKEIADKISAYLGSDKGYKLDLIKDGNGGVTMAPVIDCDIRNENPMDHFAPFFQVESLEQAKRIIKDAIINTPDSEVDRVVNGAIKRNQVDLTKDLFLGLYRPNRRWR